MSLKGHLAQYDKQSRVIRFRTALRNTVLDVLQERRDWEEDKDNEELYHWDFLWTDMGWIRDHFDAFTNLQDHQRINHFPNHYELTRKDLLIKNLNRMKKQLCRSLNQQDRQESEKYTFWSATFVLPMEYSLFVEEFKRYPNCIWIMKPIGKAQGRGIFLFDQLNDINQWKRDHTWKLTGGIPQKTNDTYIVQKYIANPYLIAGKKFDLRLYVLVTSFSPLYVWLYRSGFGRFSSVRYSTAREDMENTGMHCTNSTLQKQTANYDETVGCKWHLHGLKQYLISRHGPEKIKQVFNEIECIVQRSLLSVQQSIIQQKHCFELYGYDILLDEELKPWLLEVNASPSLTGDTKQDYELKKQLIQHTLDVIDMESHHNGNEKTIGGYDLIWANGPIPKTSSNMKLSYLGCAIPDNE